MALFDYTPEELQKILERAQKELQEKLAAMTPEERERVGAVAQEMMEADEAEREQLLDDAINILGAQTAAEPKVCGHCGAKAEGGGRRRLRLLRHAAVKETSPSLIGGKTPGVAVSRATSGIFLKDS